MEEGQTGGKKGEDRGGPMRAGGKDSRRSRLVVVFQKARQPALKIDSGAEIRRDGPRLPSTQSVVEGLVVGEVETLCWRVHSRSQ
jgi:hypothetical protein